MTDIKENKREAEDHKSRESGEKPVSELGVKDGFYRGFDRPDPVKVNLAGDHKEFTPSPPFLNKDTTEEEPAVLYEDQSEIIVPEEADKGVSPSTVNQKKPEPEDMPTKPQKKSEPVNIKLHLMIFGGGLIGACLLGGAVYFGAGYYYKGKIDVLKNELADLGSEKSNLEIAPEPLQLPIKVVPESNASAPVETPVVEQEPIEQEQPEIPETGNG